MLKSGTGRPHIPSPTMPHPLAPTDQFADRHIGPSDDQIDEMLDALELDSLDALVRETIPKAIRTDKELDLPPALSEYELGKRVEELASKNDVFRSFIGMGYHDTVTPPVLQRNILENPSWYTQYTPYQAEISQGRLEALLNFQTAVIDLTGLEIANASLLDEGTAAAEAMLMLNRLTRRQDADKFFMADDCHPQTIAVVEARAEPIGVEIVVGDALSFEPDESYFGALVQYPATDGAIYDYEALAEALHDVDAYLAVAADLLSLTLLRPPGAFGADVAIGNTQRFGVPLGYGGPHAAFFATRESFKRKVPGRIIGVTKDADGNRALRMALQTREQHIRRGKATSNICTAQVLLAVIAGAYAVYHGPEGLRRIAERVHRLTRVLADALQQGGHTIRHDDYFDTLRVDPGDGTSPETILTAAKNRQINLRTYDDGSLGIALDETTSAGDLVNLLMVFGCAPPQPSLDALADKHPGGYSGALGRTSSYLEHPTFQRYHSETSMMRYLQTLAGRDLSLTTSMIPLGSCTMKLNPAATLLPITMARFNKLHPFAPAEQAQGYLELVDELAGWLAEITGFDGASLQPNSGASGEYAGLLTIRAYHRDRGEAHRNVCLVPASAHGTNPASAVMAGMKVVTVKSTDDGDIDMDDLKAKAEKHGERLAALMVTYPSTHGVFEEEISDICDIVHAHGGQVYMDGANMNAQVGLARPGEYGADVCHLNLHKTFAIPHGGGGPGMGPICTAEHLTPFLPGHPLAASRDEKTAGGDREIGGEKAIGPVSAAPYGSASILLISWAYIALLGPDGLSRASRVAILNANYLAKRLEKHYEIAFRGRRGRVAHEFILDLRPYRQDIGINEQDVAKRLMDYNYHAPTMSWPVVGTMMIEPTESESKEELDRFVAAMVAIRAEIEEVANAAATGNGTEDSHNVLKQAPHTATLVTADQWDMPYGREKAAFPLDYVRDHKFWPTVRRVDDAHGDRHLICACPPVEAYAEAE